MSLSREVETGRVRRSQRVCILIGCLILASLCPHQGIGPGYLLAISRKRNSRYVAFSLREMDTGWKVCGGSLTSMMLEVMYLLGLSFVN